MARYPASDRAMAVDLDALAKSAKVTIDTPKREIVLRCTVGTLSAGNAFMRITAGDLDDDIANAAMRAAAAAALEVLAEHDE